MAATPWVPAQMWTAGFAHNVHYSRVVSKHREDGSAEIADLTNGRSWLSAKINQRLHFPLGAVVDRNLVAAVEESARHRLAHAAEADKANFHDASLNAAATRRLRNRYEDFECPNQKAL
jgi:hypothetical protein